MNATETSRYLGVTDNNPAWEDGEAAGQSDRRQGFRLTGDELVGTAEVYAEMMIGNEAPLTSAALAAYYVLGYLAATCSEATYA